MNPTIDVNFCHYADLQFHRHQLLATDSEHDRTIESIEDQLTALWATLDEPQRQSLNGMSADLNWIRRNGERAPRGRRADEVADSDRLALALAIEQRDWHAILLYLRHCAAVVSPPELAQLRAEAYAQLGFPEMAEAFAAFARQLEVFT